MSLEISQFKASAARIPNSNAALFITGKTPGYPQSITFVLLFGSAPKCAGAGEKIFELVFNSTWTSSPMIVSKFIRLSLLKLLVFDYGIVLLAQKHRLLGTLFFHQNNYQ